MRVRLGLMIVAALTASSCGGESTGTEDASSTTTTITATTSTSGASETEDTSTPQIAEYEVTSDLTYADGVLLDVYHPTAEGPWPVVVFAPGKGVGKNIVGYFGSSYAERGAVAFVLTMSDDPPFLETVQDIACAVRYARVTAADYGGDPDTVTLVGFSLGASAGAVAALSGDDHTEGCVETDASALPHAFVGYEGPYDWAHTDYPLGLELLEQDDPVLWAAIDPYAHVGRNPDLIVRLIHGVDENVVWYDVPPEVSEEYQQALAVAGHDVEVVLVDGAGHSADPGDPQFDAIVTQALTVADSS